MTFVSSTGTARPARLRRPCLLIIGCGDVGLRVVRHLARRWRVLALTSSPTRRTALREAGVVPLVGDLDAPESLARLAGLADAVLHLAPPPAAGATDPRTRHLLQALARSGRIRRIVYASTTGVYGDCGGDRIDETRRVRPATDRARRRVDAERLVFASGLAATVLRVPGIYANDRAGGDLRDRVRAGAPVLDAADDVYTNHIHADDLARACVAALHRGPAPRVVHVSDDTDLRMGDCYDLVADLAGLPRPPRISRSTMEATTTPMRASFMSESRRLVNRRLKTELRLRLRYPTVAEGLAAPAWPAPAAPDMR